jgi:hypothetical protein
MQSMIRWHSPSMGLCLAAAAAVWLAPARLAGQAPTPTAKQASTWKLPRTPDGQPDLQGMWTNGTLTPFERPGELADKAFLTEDEAAAQQRQATERRANAARNRRPGDVGGDNEAFVDTGYKIVSTRQTSLVVDPPDGRVPILPAAERKRDFNLANVDSYESMSPWDRCITRGPTALFPAGYNNAYQIVQTPTHVVIVSEMIHEARIIPLDGRPHVGPGARLWTGDARGHWEGATLVVDTTNFNDRGWITTHAGSGRLRGVPHGEALHLVERFTRVDADTISYDMTVDDPSAFTRPWKFSMPLTRNESYQMFEYACHEGNQAVGLILRGARTQEKAAAEAAPAAEAGKNK